VAAFLLESYSRKTYKLYKDMQKLEKR
jgi:hypothetical protein